MNVGEIKRMALTNMREYVSGDVVQNSFEYNSAMITLINEWSTVIATVSRKVERLYKISQLNPENLLGEDWEQEGIHESADKTYSAASVGSFSFEVAGYATVYVEEETSTGVWTNLITYTKTLTSYTKAVTGGATTTVTLDGQDKYVLIKGNTNPSVSTNNVRIRFSGTYRYPYRYIGLFAFSYPTDSECPDYKPWVSYAMPANFYELKKVEVERSDKALEEFANFRWEKDGTYQYFKIRWEEKGEFSLSYWAFPAKIAEPPLTALDTYDSTEVDLAEEAIPALALIIGSVLLKTQDTAISDRLRNEFYQEMNNLEDKFVSESPTLPPINNNNW